MKRLSFLLGLPLALVSCSAGTSATSVTASPTAAPTTAAPSPTTTAEKPVAAENNPPGDIPDNIAFITYANPAGKFSFTHPEGWAETTRGTTVTFTDKLNGVHGERGSRTSAPTVESARAEAVPALRRTEAAFELRAVTAVTEPAGSGVRIVYRRNSSPDPVTGRQYRDEVERYELVSHGREVVIELYGPVGADNVDAYKTMITSLTLT